MTTRECSPSCAAKILATLGPASSRTETIRALFDAGADVFRLNFSHRSQKEHRERYQTLRQLERETGRPSRAAIVPKLEKPAVIDDLEAIVELPAEQVPRTQKRIVRACRKVGKPVIIATQMMESMITSPVPTRAEASDVATAIYDGVDAVMLSAESAAGKYPVEAVRMMDTIIREVESDPHYRTVIKASSTAAVEHTIADAICASLRHTTSLLPIGAVVTYTRSGYTSLRAARERP